MAVKHKPADVITVVGYVRVSTAEQANSGAGLGAQRAAIEDECRRRGWELAAIHEDAGISGKAIWTRPGLDAALTALTNGEASALVVAKLDRLSRSLLDFASLLARAEHEGWKLLPLDLGVDLTTPAGEFMAAIMAAMAQWERRIISLRTREGLAVKRAQGVRLGAPPLISPDVAARCAAMRREGVTLQGIADQLNADEVPTPRGGPWRPSTLARVLNREGAPTFPRGPRPVALAAAYGGL